jgi:citrate lyase subunit beta/citryl-CoA lyase
MRPPLDVGQRPGRGTRDRALARSLGLGGKACIHPAQLEVVNRVFGPSDEQLAWAARVVEAFELGLREGKGAVALDGEMIDLPVVERARRLLEASEA